MDDRTRRALWATALLASAPVAESGTIHQCLGADGAPWFSDVHCANGGAHRELALEHQQPVVFVPLSEADRAQLEGAVPRPSANRRRIGGADSAHRRAACVAARRALEAHRIAARRPHRGSLLAQGRARRRAVRTHCH